MKLQRHFRTFAVVVAGLALLALSQAQQPSLRILSPQNGAVVDTADIAVRMEVKGVLSS